MVLETKRLILRDWELADAHDLVSGLNNIEVSQWLAFVPYPYTLADAESWIRFCLQYSNNDKDRPFYHFAIELKSEQKVIGGVSLDKISRQQGTAGGGVWLNADYHHQGYGSEAFGKRIEFAFDQLQLRRLENGYFKDNEPSFKMQQKFGYQVEGKRRKSFVCMANGQIMDEMITGLLKEEWIRG